jgi:Mn2+/Fe2+ NRAMP family transporter
MLGVCAPYSMLRREFRVRFVIVMLTVVWPMNDVEESKWYVAAIESVICILVIVIVICHSLSPHNVFVQMFELLKILVAVIFNFRVLVSNKTMRESSRSLLTTFSQSREIHFI